MNSINEFISKNKLNKLRIAVLGDSCLDIFYSGKVSKISPEFPVQILKSETDEKIVCCGMASNVCNQLKHFNVDTFLISFIDFDSKKLFLEQKFNIDQCFYLRIGSIPKKIRFYDDDFPLLRWDIEQENYGGFHINYYRNLVLENLKKIKNLDAVILSDYGKGFWSDELASSIIDYCNENNIITVVDPKKDLLRWKNCTIFKPNSKEALELTGLSDWKGQCDFIQEKLNCHGVVITQAGDGIVGKNQEYFEYQYKSKTEVNSKIGGGDVFASILTTALCHKINLFESSKIAFLGGLEYVKAKHNKPITIHDIYYRFDPISAKIISVEDLLYLKNKVYNDQKFVFTNGCFDFGLTFVHVKLLQQAKTHGDKLIVAINSDESIKRLKGENRPIMNLEERMQIIASLEFVDYVIFFEEDTPLEVIKKINPSKIIKGNYKKEDVVGKDICEVIIIEKIEGISTSDKINKLYETLQIIS